MITIFNRKELMLTTPMDVSVRVRDLLVANGIDYLVKVRNLQDLRGGRSGTYGLNTNYTHEYRIYVHKKDHEKAQWLIRNL